MLFGLEIRGAAEASPIRTLVAVFLYGYGLILLACFIIGDTKRNAGAKPIWTSARLAVRVHLDRRLLNTLESINFSAFHRFRSKAG